MPISVKASPKVTKVVKASKRAAVASDKLTDVKAIVKRYFHRSFVGRTVGRIEQKALIQSFLDGPFGVKGLYIAGNPGTGKTAVVSELISERACKDHLIVNCIMEGSVKAINKTITKYFKVLKISELFEVTLVLDEVDFLAEKDISYLLKIFANDKIKVIGVANTLDSSYIKIPLNLVTPLSFPPYTVDDITAILSARLQFANSLLPPVFQLIDSAAIELCSRKIAITGDLRRALDILQLAIDMSTVSTSGGSIINIQLVLDALNKVMPSAAAVQSKLTQLLAQCNIHQQLLLAGLIMLRRREFEAKPSITKLHSEYNKIRLEGRFGDGLPRADFLDALHNLESLNILKFMQNKTTDKWAGKVYLEGDPLDICKTLTEMNSVLNALLSIQ